MAATKSYKKHVAFSLAEFYKHYFWTPSGDVQTSIRFSENPREWKIIANAAAGPPYEGFRSDVVPSHRTNAVIQAVISRKTWESHPAPVPYLYHAEYNEYFIIAGIQTLTPPPGIDGLELLCVCTTVPATKVRIRPHWLLRFRHGNITFHCADHSSTPPPLKTYLPEALELFHQHVAACVAARLNPKPRNRRMNFHMDITTWVKTYVDWNDGPKVHPISTRLNKATFSR